MFALGHETVTHGVALFGVGGPANKNLLILSQNISDGDSGTVKSAQRSYAVFLWVLFEVLKLIRLLFVLTILLILFLTALLLGSSHVKLEWLLNSVASHDVFVINSHWYLGAVSQDSLADL